MIRLALILGFIVGFTLFLLKKYRKPKTKKQEENKTKTN